MILASTYRTTLSLRVPSSYTRMPRQVTCIIEWFSFVKLSNSKNLEFRHACFLLHYLLHSWLFQIYVFKWQLQFGDKWSNDVGWGPLWMHHQYRLINKNWYVVRNAGCARSRYTLKWSLILFKAINQWINRVNLEWLIRC